MIGSTTSSSLLTRLAIALAWRRNEDIARRLAGFAATEAGSALDMLKAAETCDDADARRLFFRHALDEARHAELFQRAARSLSADADAARWSDYAVIHATRQNLLADLGYVTFLAFVYVAEKKAAQKFEALRVRFADRPEIAELFDAVLADERFHVAYSKHPPRRAHATGPPSGRASGASARPLGWRVASLATRGPTHRRCRGPWCVARALRERRPDLRRPAPRLRAGTKGLADARGASAEPRRCTEAVMSRQS